MFLSVLNPQANEGSEEDYRGYNVEHEADKVRADDFEVEGESSHLLFSFSLCFVEVELRGED